MAFSEQKYFIQKMRQVFRWYPARKECRDEADCGKDLYICAQCLQTYDRKFTYVDHIEPVVSVEQGWQGYDVYMARLFCPKENLQVLCKACHSKKSKAENAARRKHNVRREKA